jgi:hypothetical protein
MIAIYAKLRLFWEGAAVNCGRILALFRMLQQ